MTFRYEFKVGKRWEKGGKKVGKRWKKGGKVFYDVKAFL